MPAKPVEGRRLNEYQCAQPDAGKYAAFLKHHGGVGLA
jgi:hypothetical protein